MCFYYLFATIQFRTRWNNKNAVMAVVFSSVSNHGTNDSAYSVMNEKSCQSVPDKSRTGIHDAKLKSRWIEPIALMQILPFFLLQDGEGFVAIQNLIANIPFLIACTFLWKRFSYSSNQTGRLVTAQLSTYHAFYDSADPLSVGDTSKRSVVDNNNGNASLGTSSCERRHRCLRTKTSDCGGGDARARKE